MAGWRSIVGSAYAVAYAASKGALVRMAKSPAAACAGNNIQVNAVLIQVNAVLIQANAVSLGWIDTGKYSLATAW